MIGSWVFSTMIHSSFHRTVHTLHHIADVHLILQNPPHGSVAPQAVVIGSTVEIITVLLLIKRRVGDSHSVKFFDDADNTAAADIILINHADDRRGVLINYQLMVILGVFPVAVGGERADKFPLSAVIVQRAADIDRGGSGVALVNDVCHADGNAPRGGVHAVAGGVDAVVEGDKANAEPCKLIIDQISADRVVSAETRQILDDDAVDSFESDILHEPCPARPVKIRSRIAVVYIGIDMCDIGVQLQILLQNLSLIRDGRAFGFVFVHVLLGETDVKGSLPCLDCPIWLSVIVLILLHKKLTPFFVNLSCANQVGECVGKALTAFIFDLDDSLPHLEQVRIAYAVNK